MCHTRTLTKFHLHPKQQIEDSKMAEAKGLSTPVTMKSELAALVGASSLPRTEITKKLWDYIKANKLQTKTVNGAAMDAGKYIVCDAKLHPIFKNLLLKLLPIGVNAFIFNATILVPCGF